MKVGATVLSWASRRRRRTREAHGLILLYHRVARPTVDPWRLAVSPRNFRSQVEVLSRVAQIVPLVDLPQQISKRSGGKPAVAITFDDGYVDNLDAGIPVLREFGVEGTVFVVTGAIGQPYPFWWDRLARIVLGPEELPETLDVRNLPLRDRLQGESALPAKGRRPRSSLHRRLWEALRLADPAEQHEVLTHLSGWAGVVPASDEVGRPMRQDEILQIQHSGDAAIGAHTVTHRPLAELPLREQEEELSASLDHLERLLGDRPTTVAYPHGSMTPHTPEAAGRAGATLACSTVQDLAWAGWDPLQLPRVSVGDWSAAPFETWLRRYWLP
jgi:peptidoglycan/xylan/chitin deacetylase (PgdA/CDA1 family)